MSSSNSPQKQPQDPSATAASTLCALGRRLVASSKRGQEVALSPHELKAARRAANLLLDAAERHSTTEADRAYNLWAESGAELLSLFALAVRRSSTSLYPDASNDELQAYDQLRRGLCTELRLLTTAARDLCNLALLSGLGCALLRMEVLQAYSRLAADAADELRPAARAACADLPQPQGLANAVTELLVDMGRAQPTGPVSPRALSASLRLVDEVLLLLDVLCACKGRADLSGVKNISAEFMVRTLQLQPCDGADGPSPGAGGGTPGQVEGEGRGLEPSAYEKALWQETCIDSQSELYSHAVRLLLLATAAARGSAAHRGTHELAGTALQGLWYRLVYLQPVALAVPSAFTNDYGVAVSEVVRLCGALDGGGTTYGMAPGLWPQPPWAGEGGADWVMSKECQASKALLAVTVAQWRKIFNSSRRAQATPRYPQPDVAGAATTLSLLRDNFRRLEQEQQAKGARKLRQRRLAETRAAIEAAASELLETTDTMFETVALVNVPSVNPLAAAELCLRLARGLLAGWTGQHGLAGNSGAPAPAAGPPATGERAGLSCTSTATAAPAAPGAGGGAAEGAGAEGAEAGAAAARSVTGADEDQGVQSARRLRLATDRALLHAALHTGRAAWLYADVVGMPGDRRAQRRRALALLRSWWRVFVAAARQGLAPPPDADTGGTAECAASPPEGLRPAVRPTRPSADTAAALAAGLLPCCAELLHGRGRADSNGSASTCGIGASSGAGTTGQQGGGSGGGGSSAQGAASSSTAADSPVTSGASERSVCSSPGSLEGSSRQGRLLRCLRMCSWPQLLAFGGRGEVRQLTSALAWRLGWQVEMLRGAVEAAGPAGRQGSAGAGLASEAVLQCEEVGELLMFVSCRLEDVLWLRGQVGRGREGQGGEGAGGASGRSKGSSVGDGEERTTAAPGAGSEATSGAPGAGAAAGGAAPGGEAGLYGAGASTGAEGAGDGGSGGAPAAGQAVEGSGCHASACGSGTAGSSAGGEAASAAASGGGDERVAECMLAAAPVWQALSELLPAASRAVAACVELLLPEGVGGRAGAGTTAAAGLHAPEVNQFAHGICSSCVSVLRCASLLLVAHVGAGEAGDGDGMAHSPWRGVLLGEVGLVRLLGAWVRLLELVGGGAGAEEGRQQQQLLQVLLPGVLFVAALAFPAELRAGVQDGGGAAGAKAGGEGACMSGGLPAPPCRMRLSALRAMLGACGGGGGEGQGGLGEMEVVCRVAGGWEPEPGERRVLLQRGCRRLAGVVWRRETEG